MRNWRVDSRIWNLERIWRDGSFVFYENRFAHETKSVSQFLSLSSVNHLFIRQQTNTSAEDDSAEKTRRHLHRRLAQSSFAFGEFASYTAVCHQGSNKVGVFFSTFLLA